MSVFGDIARGLGDVMTFGSNELLGNPIGKFADEIVSGPGDPNAYQREVNAANLKYQREFAQHGIQWRVEDAKRAGLSPLVGAGVSEPSFSNLSATVFPEDNSIRNIAAETLAGMGQDLWRSHLAGSNQSVRELEAARLKTAQAQADLATTQAKLAKLSLVRAQVAPSIPSDSQLLRGPDGVPYLVPSSEFAQAAHGTLGSQWRWALNNTLLPSVSALNRNLFIPVLKDLLFIK